MRYIKPLLSLIVFCAFTKVWAQLSTNEKPVSFGRESELRVSRRSANPTVTMPQLDMAKIEKEDSIDNSRNIPPRFAYPHRVNYNLNNSGTWYKLSNGDKLWQFHVSCPNAKSVHFCYDKFWIPEGGRFFVYSRDKKQTLGAYTSKNNKGDREHLRGFTTGLVYGNDVVLEYYHPKEAINDAIISIKSVLHGYNKIIGRYEVGFGKSADCMVNINCPIGNNWQSEKHAVALMIFDDSQRYCSGALINTTKFDESPLFLTAYHCTHAAGYYTNGDSLFSNPVIDDAMFCWNYEVANCNDSIEPIPYYTHCATVVANNYMGEFALLQLSEDPKVYLPNFTPCYLGWDNSGQPGYPGVCIHHPLGDVKKISTVDTLISTWHRLEYENLNGDHWKVDWANGITQDGSSGSPLFNASHKVIGLLHGGDSQCGETNPHDWFAKFSAAWNPYDIAEHQRLDCWLDTLGSTVQSLETLFVIPTTKLIDKDGQLWGIIHIKSTGQLTIQGNIEAGENGIMTVESGGKLIIDGGRLSNVNLDLKPGATLRIMNGGIIETRNGFTAPIGAFVEISHGKIL